MTTLSRQILPIAYRYTAIADLLAYHNLEKPHRCYSQPRMLVGMCMDHRKHLRIPENFAYIMRAGGANFRGLDFQISSAIAVGGVRAIALIGHDQCGMYGLATRREDFVNGLVDGAGWDRHVAERHFETDAPRFETGDPIDFTLAQVRHLRRQYPRLTVAPLFYQIDDGRLHIIDDNTLTNETQAVSNQQARAR